MADYLPINRLIPGGGKAIPLLPYIKCFGCVAPPPLPPVSYNPSAEYGGDI